MNEKDVFLAAYRLDDPAERDRYLENACADRPALLVRVRELLRLSDEAGSLMKPPESPTFASTTASPGIGEAVSSVIGPYKLLETIGEGGIGVRSARSLSQWASGSRLWGCLTPLASARRDP